MRMTLLLSYLALLVSICCIPGFQGVAVAAALGPDLSVSGTMELDIDPSLDVGTDTAAGSYYSRVGGVDTTTVFDGTGVTSGSDPLTDSPTHTGDGFGSTFSIGADYVDPDGADFLIGLDLDMSVTNNSVTDTYAVTLGVSYGNSVNSSGIDGSDDPSLVPVDDAYAESEFSVSDDTANVELFFSHLLSDTLFGDEQGGVGLGTFGDLLTDNGFFSFGILLTPGEVFNLAGAWTWQGGVYADPGTSVIDFSSFIGIESFENRTSPPAVIPEPGTFLLLGSGLVGLALYARRRHS